MFCNPKGGGVIYIFPSCLVTKFRIVLYIDKDGCIILMKDSVKYLEGNSSGNN